jgi:hypothetical protein
LTRKRLRLSWNEIWYSGNTQGVLEDQPLRIALAFTL